MAQEIYEYLLSIAKIDGTSNPVADYLSRIYTDHDIFFPIHLQ